MKKKKNPWPLKNTGLLKMIKMMRFTIFIVLVSLTQTFAVNSYSQQTKLNFDLRNTRVEDVIDQIERSSEFFFLYNRNLIDVDRKIDIKAENESVREVLEKMFQGTDVSFTIKDRQIMLAKIQTEGTQPNVQQASVTGKVTDTAGLPLPGVTVLVKGTTTGTITDGDGRYSLSNVPPNTILVFSFVGMRNQEIAVGNQSTINVMMAEDAIGIEEVVAVGYMNQRKADLTGAVSVVDAEDIMKQSVANPMKALQGQVPGMYITGNGSPKSETTVRIRGIGTLNDNNPLYIIDGVPTKAGMHELNSADIESMQVLKDASAASIYGSRAGNGVIIITTKQAKTKGVKVSANAYTSVSTYTDKVDMLNTEEYGRVLWQANINSNLDPNNNGIGYYFDWTADPTSNQPKLNKVLVPEFLDEKQTMRSSDTDWFDEISNVGIVQNYDLQLQNGTENGNYFLSFGYYDNEGIIKTTNFNRLSVRLNSDFQLFKGRVKIGENISLSKTNEVAANVINASVHILPVIPVRTVDGTGWGGPSSGMNDRQNPVRLLEDNKQNDYDYFRLFGSFFAEAKLLKGLIFKSNLGLDYGSYYARQWQIKYVSGYLKNDVNKVINNQSHNIKTTWTNTLNYNLDLKDHKFSALAGVEQFKERVDAFMASREDYVIEDKNYMYLDAGTGLKDNSGYGAENTLLSYFGKVNYSFLDRYLFSATVRYDGSSRFGENDRFGTFPAFSLGWRLSEESFIKNNFPGIDDLKLRFGWGKTGNQEIENNAIYNIYLSDYNTTSYDINGDKSGVLPSGYYLSQNANPNLRWEATEMSNIGLDFTFFKQKMYGSVDGYIKKTSDILIRPPYVGVLGEGGNLWVNGASMQNKGLEFMLGYREDISKDLSFEAVGNLDIVRNKVTHLPEAVVNAYGGDGRGQNILGRTLGSYFGYVADGLYRSPDELNNGIEQVGKGLGRIRYKDLNDDKVIDDYDRTWIGVPLPKFTYGLNLAINYKNFDLSIFLQGLGSIDVNNQFKIYTDFWSADETNSNKGARLLDAWTVNNSDSDIPAVALNDDNFEARLSTYFVENGMYLKLRNVQLGYTFNKQMLSKLGLQSLRVYAGGDNLGILLKSKSFTGLDPENPGFGYPNPVVVTGGINVVF